MSKGFFNVPKAVNEPVKSYAPGTPERDRVLTAYDEMWNTTIDVPLYIGSEEIRTGNTRTMSAPHDHQHIVGTYHLAEKSHVETPQHKPAAVVASKEPVSKTSVFDLSPTLAYAIDVFSCCSTYSSDFTLLPSSININI